jgi:hypothetical protein
VDGIRDFVFKSSRQWLDKRDAIQRPPFTIFCMAFGAANGSIWSLLFYPSVAASSLLVQARPQYPS